MLRSHIGDEDFRKSLKIYIERYRGKSAETGDLRKIMEDVSGINLLQFFDQWIYTAGHPRLDIEFSFEESQLRLKISQGKTNNDDSIAFQFPLDIKLVYSSNGNDITKRIEQLEISKKVTEKSIDLPKDAKLRYISVDPELKILRK